MRKRSAKASGVREKSIIKPYFFQRSDFPENYISPVCAVLPLFIRGKGYYYNIKNGFTKNSAAFFSVFSKQKFRLRQTILNRIFAGVFLTRIRPVFSGKFENPEKTKKIF